MGLPEILIEFKTRAETAVKRSQNGIVAIILRDGSKAAGSGYDSYSYNVVTDVTASHWTAKNKKYLDFIFKGNPKKVLVERIQAGDSWDVGLERLKNKKWNWLTIPELDLGRYDRKVYSFDDAVNPFTAYSEGVPYTKNDYTPITCEKDNVLNSIVAKFNSIGSGNHQRCCLNLFEAIGQEAGNVKKWTISFYFNTGSGGAAQFRIGDSEKIKLDAAIIPEEEGGNTDFDYTGEIFIVRGNVLKYGNTSFDTSIEVNTWHYAEVTIDEIAKTISYKICLKSNGTVISSGTSSWKGIADKCDMLSVVNGGGMIDNLFITAYADEGGTQEVQAVSEWVIAQREGLKKTFKAILPNCTANHEGIVNFTTDNIVSGGTTYTTSEYCTRIAGLLAGLSMTESATYQVLEDVTSITESTTPDIDIDGGKFILINDGEKIKVGRGINSLHILSGDKTEDMKKIKIIEGMDIMRDDIRITFEENYIGINNSYDNKILFVAAVNQYFNSLARQGVLYDEYENAADIDVEAQREWLSQRYDISEYTDEQIRKAKTRSYVFVAANVQFADAIEDLRFIVSME